MDTAVAMAVLEFNKGSSGFISVLEKLTIHSGHHFMTYIYISLSTHKWRKDAARHASTATKKVRLSRKLFKAVLADLRAAKKGVIYEAGGLITDNIVVHCIIRYYYFISYSGSAVTIINIWTLHFWNI